MAGIREKKKKLIQDRIMSISRQMFQEKGYNDTTMDEIAEKAELGVGTLYNYFKSKTEIFLAIMTDDLIISSEDQELFFDDLQKDVTELIMIFIRKTFKNMKMLGKRVWKELMSAVFSTKSSNILFRNMIGYDYKFIEKLMQFFEDLKQQGKLMNQFNCYEAAYAVYSVMIAQLMMYIYVDDIEYEMLEKNIRNQISFIMEGKCGDK